MHHVQKENGQLRFTKDQYLTSQQIQSQWSKMARCRREQIPLQRCNFDQPPVGEEGDKETAENQHYLDHPILEEAAVAEDITQEAIDNEICESEDDSTIHEENEQGQSEEDDDEEDGSDGE